MKYGGALPDRLITELVENGFIENANVKNVCTDTYDPVTTGEVYRLPRGFLPNRNERIGDFVHNYGIRVKPDSILEAGVCYIFRLAEKFVQKIPDGVHAHANPKSNIGRVDILSRLLADGVPKFNFVPRGYTGLLWNMVEARSFAVIANEGMSFSQIRFFNQETRLDELRLGTIFNSQGGMLFDRHGGQILYEDMESPSEDGSIPLSLGLDFSVVGFEAIKNGEPINLSLANHYDPRCFFREIFLSNDSSINFNPNSFSILSTEESVRVLPTLACEMIPMDEGNGEIRVHYAGYIAPGWGVGPDGTGKGRPLTLEVRCFESGFMARRGQPFAKIYFDRMIERPLIHYDQQPGTKFKVQDGPGLAKYFKSWK